MEYRRFEDTIIIRMDPGEEILSTLNDVALREDIRLAEVSALGAINEFTVGLYDRGEHRYHSNSFAFDAEIVSLTGTITYANELPYLHLHMSAADKDGRVFGGHLNRAVVSCTCEMAVRLIPGEVGRIQNPETGLNIFQFPGEDA